MFVQKIKKPNLNFLFLLIFILIFIHALPKKIFLIHKNSFLDRKINFAYDYCGKLSTGYIFYLKKKKFFHNPPKIINNRTNLNQYWTFYTNKKYNDEYVVILSNFENNKVLKNLLDEYKIVHNHKNDCLLLKKK